MRKLLFLTVFICLLQVKAIAQQQDSLTIRKIYNAVLTEGDAYKNLVYLCKQIGPRLSGSKNAQKAVEWSRKLMETYGFDRVYLQEVKVPHWERGAKEIAKIISGKEQIIVPIAALGGSVSTPEKGITAAVVEVQSIDELKGLGEGKVKGKIVFFNRKFDPTFIETSEAYGAAVDQRGQGPIEAAKLGAVGVIVRSMTHVIDDNPHTGSTHFDPNGKNIPAAAISTKGAETLSRLLKLRKATPVQFFFKQNCKTFPDALSYNVIGEIKGTENPEEIIVVGGHLDSWDLAEGAHDDGAGVVESIEVLRVLKSLNYRPKRTLRAVLFMNEENGNRGGAKYAEIAGKQKENHLAAIESDAGGFTPRGFSMEAPDATFQQIVKNWKPLFTPYQTDRITQGESGVDIYPLKSTVPGIILFGFRPDSQRYFDIHHSTIDILENVNQRELELGAAAMTALVYLIDQHGLQFKK